MCSRHRAVRESRNARPDRGTPNAKRQTKCWLYIRQNDSIGCQASMVPRVRTAFVLGAGLGTRLRPLTNVIPKPLLPIFGKRLVPFALDHLIASGVEQFVI